MKPTLKMFSSFFVLLALGLALHGSVTHSPTTSDSSGCYRVALQAPDKGLAPLWISSATWIDSTSEVGVVDPWQNTIFLYSETGVPRVLEPATLQQSDKSFFPASIEATRSGYLVKMVDQRTLWLDQSLNLKRQENLAKASGGPRGEIGALYDLTVAGEYFLAFGSVKQLRSTKHRFGFFRAPLREPSKFDFLLEDTYVDFYLLGHDYLGALGRDAYFVLMKDEAAIYRVPASGRARIEKLNAFPKGYARVPALPVSTGPTSDEALYQAIEGQTLAVGLYGQDFLYLLTREPSASNQGTVWYLHQIDPRSDKVLGKMRLPTAANHLAVAVAPQAWYFFERGPVLGLSQQKVPTMLVVPTELIKSRSVPSTCPTRQR